MTLHVFQRRAAFLSRAVIATFLTLSPGSARGGPLADPAPNEDAEASRLRDELGRLIADAAAGFKEAKGDLSFRLANGGEGYATRLGLTGCSSPRIWLSPSGELKSFDCDLVLKQKGLGTVRALLGPKAQAIAAALPTGWKATTNPRAAPFEPFLLCRGPTADLTLRVFIASTGEGTYFADLDLTKLERPPRGEKRNREKAAQQPSECPEEEGPGISVGSSPAVPPSGEPAGGGSPDGFYLGTLSQGDRQLDVALELGAKGGGALSGSYYYFKRTPESLTLRGTLATDGAFRLEESGEIGAVTGLWTGTLAGGELRGTWRDPKKSRCWRFHLSRSERATRYFEGAPRSVETGITGSLSYVTARVPNSSHKVPLLTSFRDPAIVSSINATLVGAAANAHCEREPDDFVFNGEVSFAGEGLLGVRIAVWWFCQAAHPNDDDRSLLFDLRTGRSIQKDELLRKDASPEETAEVLFPYELSESRKLQGAPEATEGRSREEPCADHWTLEWFVDRGFSVHHLTAEGLVVAPAFPHVIAACANEVTVPYGALAPIVAPGGPLARLVAASTGKSLRYRIHAPETKPEDDLFFTPPKRN